MRSLPGVSWIENPRGWAWYVSSSKTFKLKLRVVIVVSWFFLLKDVKECRRAQGIWVCPEECGNSGNLSLPNDDSLNCVLNIHCCLLCLILFNLDWRSNWFSTMFGKFASQRAPSFLIIEQALNCHGDCVAGCTKPPRPQSMKKWSLRHQLLYTSITRSLNESSVAEDGSIIWHTPSPRSPSSNLRPTTR